MSKSKKNNLNWFAVMWDCNGLEAVARIPDPKLTTFALLRGEQPPDPPNLMVWELRARYNMQRHYEIYLISTDSDIDEQDIRQLFQEDPQSAADLIRSRGTVQYSDRVTKKTAIL